MRNALIVSPHFPPVNAPDHQRVRMSLPYLREFGWDATVLAVKPQHIEGATVDSLLETTVPDDIEVVRVPAISPAIARAVGLGNLALRALPEIVQSGREGFLVSSERELGEAVNKTAAIDRAACRRKAETCFSTEAIVPAYETLYRCCTNE